MTRAIWLFPLCLALAGCGGRDSGLNPLRWFGGDQPTRPAPLEPKGGYAEVADPRLPVPQVLAARWEPTVEGRLLVVTALAPTKGWWDVALVTQTPQPPGRLRPDADGVLHLRLVGSPPPADSVAARMPAQPGADTLTVAFPISAAALGTMTAVTVQAGGNAISLRL